MDIDGIKEFVSWKCERNLNNRTTWSQQTMVNAMAQLLNESLSADDASRKYDIKITSLLRYVLDYGRRVLEMNVQYVRDISKVSKLYQERFLIDNPEPVHFLSKNKNQEEETEEFESKQNCTDRTQSESSLKKCTKRKKRGQQSLNSSYVKEETDTCCFCFSGEDNEDQFGQFLKKLDMRVHYFCMLFSSGLSQGGESESEGILGFIPNDISFELKRGSRLKCVYCKRKGATIGCVMGSCRKVFHLPCGKANGTLHQYYDSYRSYCKEHRPCQTVPESDRLAFQSASGTSCAICFCDLETLGGPDSLKSPCCKNSWFHRTCIEQHARTAGIYFFKCPMCNNKEKFQEEMLEHGIYIPDQDAAWEREPNAFQDLHERHYHCDAKNCLCQNGRDFNIDGGKWEILLCDCCGSQGSHVACQALIKVRAKDYYCSECYTINKDSIKTSKGTHDSKKRRSSKCTVDSALAEKNQSSYPGKSSKLKKTCSTRKVESAVSSLSNGQGDDSFVHIVNSETDAEVDVGMEHSSSPCSNSSCSQSANGSMGQKRSRKRKREDDSLSCESRETSFYIGEADESESDSDNEICFKKSCDKSVLPVSKKRKIKQTFEWVSHKFSKETLKKRATFRKKNPFVPLGRRKKRKVKTMQYSSSDESSSESSFYISGGETVFDRNLEEDGCEAWAKSSGSCQSTCELHNHSQKHTGDICGAKRSYRKRKRLAMDSQTNIRDWFHPKSVGSEMAKNSHKPLCFKWRSSSYVFKSRIATEKYLKNQLRTPVKAYKLKHYTKTSTPQSDLNEYDCLEKSNSRYYIQHDTSLQKKESSTPQQKIASSSSVQKTDLENINLCSAMKVCSPNVVNQQSWSHTKNIPVGFSDVDSPSRNTRQRKVDVESASPLANTRQRKVDVESASPLSDTRQRKVDVESASTLANTRQPKVDVKSASASPLTLFGNEQLSSTKTDSPQVKCSEASDKKQSLHHGTDHFNGLTTTPAKAHKQLVKLLCSPYIDYKNQSNTSDTNCAINSPKPIGIFDMNLEENPEPQEGRKEFRIQNLFKESQSDPKSVASSNDDTETGSEDTMDCDDVYDFTAHKENMVENVCLQKKIPSSQEKLLDRGFYFKDLHETETVHINCCSPKPFALL